MHINTILHGTQEKFNCKPHASTHLSLQVGNPLLQLLSLIVLALLLHGLHHLGVVPASPLGLLSNHLSLATSSLDLLLGSLGERGSVHNQRLGQLTSGQNLNKTN